MNEGLGINKDALEETLETITPETTSRELVEELIFENETINALMKGLSDDIETFKNKKGEEGSAADIVRFTMQLNILKDKKARNLDAINQLVKKNASEQNLDNL